MLAHAIVREGAKAVAADPDLRQLVDVVAEAREDLLRLPELDDATLIVDVVADPRGEQVEAAGSGVGVSASTLYAWVHAFLLQGVAGLVAEGFRGSRDGQLRRRVFVLPRSVILPQQRVSEHLQQLSVQDEPALRNGRLLPRHIP